MRGYKPYLNQSSVAKLDDSDLPLPPPPAPSDFGGCLSSTPPDKYGNPDDLPPPPSPVSSSYSELKRVNSNAPGYGCTGYGGSAQVEIVDLNKKY